MTLLLLQPANEAFELPRADLTAERLGNVDELLTRIASERVDGVILGPAVEGPVRISQRLRALDERLPVVLVVRPERLDRARINAAAAPLVGDALYCFSADDLPGLARALANLPSRAATSAHPDDGGRKTPTHLPAARYLDRVLEGPTGIVVADVAGQVLSINRRASELLAVAEHDALGSALRELFPGLDEPAAGALLSGASSRTLSRVLPSGVEQEVEVHASPLDAPQRVGVVLMLADASAKRHAQREVARKEKLQLDLLSMISHDIRAPLGVIVGAVNELSSKDVGDINDEQRFLLSLVRKSVERLTRLAANVVYLGRMESGRVSVNLRRTDLRNVIRRVAEDMQRVEGPSIMLRVDLPDEALQADLDVERFEQVLVNLLSNAVRFAKKEVVVSGRLEGNDAVVKVIDDGTGIPADALPTIFERFSRIEAPRSGTGLGLAIVRGIVQDHGGTVTAENRRSRDPALRGAEFTVRFPQFAR